MKSSGKLMSRGSQYYSVEKHLASEAKDKARELQTGLLEVVSSVRTAGTYCYCTGYRVMVGQWTICRCRSATIAALPAPRHLQRGVLLHSASKVHVSVNEIVCESGATHLSGIACTHTGVQMHRESLLLSLLCNENLVHSVS